MIKYTEEELKILKEVDSFTDNMQKIGKMTVTEAEDLYNLAVEKILNRREDGKMDN